MNRTYGKTELTCEEDQQYDLIYTFDLIYNNSTATACINQYDDLELEIFMDDEINVDRKLQAVLKRVIERELWRDSDAKKSLSSFDKDYKIGDIVNVTYTPESQKYIEYYQEQAFTGRIIFIDDKNDNAFLMSINNEKNHVIVKSLTREGCHYLGMTPGYSYFIEYIYS